MERVVCEVLTPQELSDVALFGGLETIRRATRQLLAHEALYVAEQRARAGRTGAPSRTETRRAVASSKKTSAAAKESMFAGAAGSALPDVREQMTRGRVPQVNAAEIGKLLDGDESVAAAARADQTRLSRLAAFESPDQFRQTCRDFVQQHTDDGGENAAARRHANRRLRMWRRNDGVLVLNGEFSGVQADSIEGAIHASESALKRNPDYDAGPADPDVRRDRMRADALHMLAIRNGRIAETDADDPVATTAMGLTDIPTMVVTVSLTALQSGRLSDGIPRTDLGFELSISEARKVAARAHIIPVVLDGDGEPLDVGRPHRHATRAQRAALRAKYDAQCFCGCGTPFARTEIHHIDWWEHGGKTDLKRLIPACANSHHLIHDEGWNLAPAHNGRWKLKPPELSRAA